MSDYWRSKIYDGVECAECGGCMAKTGTAPIVKGSVTGLRCIRCTSTGGVRSTLGNEPKLSKSVRWSNK